MAKLLIIIPSLVSAGGTERVVAELSMLLASAHEVTLCSFDPEGSRPQFETGGSFVPLGASKRLPLYLRWFTYAVQARRLAALKRRLGTEISISNLWRGDLVSFLSRGRDRKVALAHTSVAGSPTNRLMVRFRTLVGSVYRSFESIVTVSDALARELTDLFQLSPGKVHIIPNFVSAQGSGKAAPGREGGARLVWCGRFVPDKNAEALVPIFREVHAAAPAARLTVIGDGPGLPGVRAAAERTGLLAGSDPPMRFTGALPDARAEIAEADLLLLPSRSEGMPMVLLEALAHGVPVVASDCPSGGVREALAATSSGPIGSAREQTSSGLLLPVPEAGEDAVCRLWAEQIVSILSDRKSLEQLREGARKNAQRFSPGAAIERWNRVIGEALR